MSKEAKPDAWMPLFIGDYKKDTGRLTRDQHGGYLLLIMEYWSTGPLADDDAELGAIALASPREWKLLRPKLERFFTVADGQWRHKRIDEELLKWSERKLRAVERARKGGVAKAGKSASSSASSTSQAVLKGCSSSSSREVDGPTGQSTLSAQNDFLGPSEVRQAFCDALGDQWCRSYLDPCAWQDVPERALIPANGYAGRKIIREARAVLSRLNLVVLERAA